MDRIRAHGGQDLSEGEPPRLSVVIPAYNEGENITAVLRDIAGSVKTAPREVIVVYDFDEDDTVPVVERLRAEMPEVVAHRNRLGRGVLNAIKAGFAAARAPYVLVMMADGSDEANVIDGMVRLAEGGADLVSASRYMRGGGQEGGPFLKRTLSRIAGLTLHWFGGVPTHDPTSNFKLYSRRLLDAVEIESLGGFELAIELTVKAHLLGMPVRELPTIWHDRTAGQSRFQMRKWIPQYLRWYLRGLWGRLA